MKRFVMAIGVAALAVAASVGASLAQTPKDTLVIGAVVFSDSIKIGVVLVLGMCLVAIFASVLSPHDPYTQNLMQRLRPPVWADRGSWVHPLGTDNLGRDLLSRLIYGSRLSIAVGLLAMVVALSIGTSLMWRHILPQMSPVLTVIATLQAGCWWRRGSPTSPGCAIVLLVLGVNLLGNGLRETLDPRRADRR
jgi:ABC-type dipeptide/oligopeptide/nickel transport system permease subunit